MANEQKANCVRTRRRACERKTDRQSQRKRKNETKEDEEEVERKIKCQTSHNTAAILMNLVSVLYK